MELVRRFDVTDLALFDSTVRDAARTDCDVDVPVAFDGPATYRSELDVKLEETD